jgi:hypothetical protein
MKMKTVCGVEYLIDDAFYHLVKNIRWFATKHGYIHAKIEKKSVFIHNLILQHNPTKYSVCDHINTNPSDNRVSNLRITSKSINSLNKPKNNYKFKTSSKFKGVSKDKKCRQDRWRAYLSHNRKTKYLGTYKTDIEAALAYNVYALKNIKEKIVLNEIHGVDYDFYIPFSLTTAGRNIIFSNHKQR